MGDEDRLSNENGKLEYGQAVVAILSSRHVYVSKTKAPTTYRRLDSHPKLVTTEVSYLTLLLPTDRFSIPLFQHFCNQ